MQNIEVSHMQEKIKLTKEGVEEKQNELRYLLDVEQPNVKIQLAEARAQGDLSENADYDAAKSRLAEIEDRIKELEDILSNYEIINEGKRGSDRVSLGSTVELEISGAGPLLDGVKKYQIVGSIEADIKKGKISHACLLGLAIMGKKVGDVVDVKARANYQVKVLSVSH